MSCVLADAVATERGWRERLHAGLTALLEYSDQEPAWARFLVLAPLVAGDSIREHRDRAVRALAGALERETGAASRAHKPRAVNAGRWASSAHLTAELVVRGVLAVLCAQMLERPGQPLSSLAPALMAFVERPYRGSDSTLEARSAAPSRRVTYRTGRVLSAIGAAPRSNNREIAEAAGLRDEGQTSKLLSRLERRGLVENVGLGAAYGEPNAWLLTADGKRVLKAMGPFQARGTRRARVRSAA